MLSCDYREFPYTTPCLHLSSFSFVHKQSRLQGAFYLHANGYRHSQGSRERAENAEKNVLKRTEEEERHYQICQK